MIIMKMTSISSSNGFPTEGAFSSPEPNNDFCRDFSRRWEIAKYWMLKNVRQAEAEGGNEWKEEMEKEWKG